MDVWWTIEGLRNRPSMWLPEVSYACLVSFLIGCDAALSGGLLSGFHELVELKYGAQTGLHWSGLALKLHADGESIDRTDEAKRTLLLDLLEEFFAVDHGSYHKQRVIFGEWARMARPDSDLLRYGSSPAPESVGLDEAAQALGIDRHGLFELVRGKKLRAGREGAEVRIVRASLDEIIETRES